MPDDFLQRLGEHLALVGGAVAGACLLAAMLAWTARLHPLLQSAANTFANAAQTIPSLALLAFLIPWLGIGTAPALAALILYATLPLLRALLTGLDGVDRELLDAARVFGAGGARLLFRVALPQAAPVLVSGLRTATVWSTGTATLGAFVGAGGLGHYITAGLSLNDTRLLLTGAVPAALLAFGLDLILGRAEILALRWKEGRS